MQRQVLFLNARRFRLATSLGILVLMVSGPRARAAESTSPSPTPGEAPRLVQAALDAELAGDATRRSELLAQALAADPDYGPARWHNGQVKFDGQWRSIDEVRRTASSDARWREYEGLRRATSDGVDDQVALAEWCRDNGLTHQERYHWAMALLAEPDHYEAREALGLREYRDGLYTDAQIDQIETREEVADRDFERYTPRMTKLCRLATRGGPESREGALAEIRAVDEAGAIDALVAAIDEASVKRKMYALDLQLALISALQGIPDHEATLRLLNRAVFSPRDEVRRQAARALRSRPATDYVPLLMAELQAPVEVDVSVFTAPDGTVRMVETISQEGPEQDRALVRSTNYEVVNDLAFVEGANARADDVLAGNLRRAEDAAARTQAQADAANAEATEGNERIEEALQAAIGVESIGSPQVWWQAWQDFNELQSLADEPVQVAFEDFTESIDVTPSLSIGASPECFVAGTPVWTQAGPRPIELIEPGDMVLAQNPESGELDFRPVLQTTLGKPVPVVRIQLPKESLTATRGHRFWVNGRGWEMAKFLESSMSVHALGGPLAVSAIDKSEPAACHNLVVDDFHTYFVGESKVLVHDRTCPQPVPASVPGSTTRRTSLPVERPMEVSLGEE